MLSGISLVEMAQKPGVEVIDPAAVSWIDRENTHDTV
jgi:hypothetical protein